jgi:hypothetical protein
VVLNPGDESGVGANLSCEYALCPCDPESESQSLRNPSRPLDLGDFDCSSFLAVSQITKTV